MSNLKIAKGSVFCNITPCSPLKSTDVSDEHLQLSLSFPAWLILHSGDEGNTFLRNDGWLSMDCMTLNPSILVGARTSSLLKNNIPVVLNTFLCSLNSQKRFVPTPISYRAVILLPLSARTVEYSFRIRLGA